jgi:restriction system protein
MLEIQAVLGRIQLQRMPAWTRKRQANADKLAAALVPFSGDGGVDVLVSRDPLRLQPPTIKVQVKRTTSSIGGPAVQALIGTLAPGGNELALFVTLGNYSSDATRIARTRQDIRLLSGAEFIDLVFEYYSKLDAEWQRLIPLRLVHAVDRDL